MSSELIQGYEAGSLRRSTTFLDDETRDGLTQRVPGRESQGYGVLVVVVGVTSHQGERESRSQGEGEQVNAILKGQGCMLHVGLT